MTTTADETNARAWMREHMDECTDPSEWPEDLRVREWPEVAG